MAAFWFFQAQILLSLALSSLGVIGRCAEGRKGCVCGKPAAVLFESTVGFLSLGSKLERSCSCVFSCTFSWAFESGPGNLQPFPFSRMMARVY